MTHRLSEDGLNATYEIKYQIGAGKVGHSYAIQVGDVLLESPASYYRRFGWDLSPGFAGTELLDFNRVLSGACLFCHSNTTQLLEASTGRDVTPLDESGTSADLGADRESDVRASSPKGHLNTGKLAAISCERCHGKTNEHLSRPSAANIVNPAKLPLRARDSICEQCHLEGAARVLNPGQALNDFRPGDNLESTLAIFVLKQSGNSIKAVSQEEQLALSQCAIKSSGRLWCGTCHNPHRKVENLKKQVKATCLSCHQALSPSTHSSNLPECVSCHMPHRSTADVAHSALTDHRIRVVRPGDVPETLAAPPELRAWREAASQHEQRDLALANLQASASPGLESLAEKAGELLASLPFSQQKDDPAVMAALGDLNLSQGRIGAALPFMQRACELVPASAEYAMYLGITLQRSNDPHGAAREFERAIKLDKSLERSYLELSALYQKEGNIHEAKRVLDDFLKWNSQAVLVRLTRKGLEENK